VSGREIQVNGEPQPLGDAETVAALMERLGVGAGARGVAVAVDGEVVPRGQWQTHALEPGDRVEVVRAVQGG
jgi:sulfur carrier protein